MDPPLLRQRTADEVKVAVLPVDSDGPVEQLVRLVRTALVAAQSRLELQDTSFLQSIARALGDETLGGGESLFGAPQIGEDAQHLPQVSPGAGLEIADEGAAVGLGIQDLADGHGEVGQFPGFARIGIEGPLGLLDQPFTEQPAPGLLAVTEEIPPFLGTLQARDQLRKTLALARRRTDALAQGRKKVLEGTFVLASRSRPGCQDGGKPAAREELPELVVAGPPSGQQEADDPAIVSARQLSSYKALVFVRVGMADGHGSS
jgi:hypothetical protein